MRPEVAKHARAFEPDEIVEDLRHVAAGWSGDSDYSRHQRDLCLFAAEEIRALRALVVQAHRDSWSDDGEQIWACRGLLSLSDEQTQVLLRALGSGSTEADS